MLYCTGKLRLKSGTLSKHLVNSRCFFKPKEEEVNLVGVKNFDGDPELLK